MSLAWNCWLWLVGLQRASKLSIVVRDEAAPTRLQPEDETN
jgi:hypothetical protein